jgi:GntR family transcriptional regulator
VVFGHLPLPEEAEALGMGSSSPETLIVRTVKDDRGRVLEVCEMVVDASKYILEYDCDL